MPWKPLLSRRSRQAPLPQGVKLVRDMNGRTFLRTSFGASIEERLAMQSGDRPEVHGVTMEMPPQNVAIDYTSKPAMEPEPLPPVPPLPKLD